MTAEKPQSLQDVLDSVPNLVDHLYGNRKGSVLKDAVLRQPTEFVAPEFTTWRDEQVAWREGIAFYDQSFHMTTTYLRGPGALPLISSLMVNSFETFGVGRSRHTVCCSPDGYVIGDGILYSVAPEELVLVGRAAGHNWVRYTAETGGFDVEIEEDEIFSHNPAGRRTVYRYQVEGPERAGARAAADRRADAQRSLDAHLPRHDRRSSGVGPAPHDGGRPGMRVLRTVGRRVRRSRRRSSPPAPRST